jgi:predicted site-specific integrase-resolvase
VNLPEWADRVGVPKFTACRWFRVGTLRVPAGRAGRLILVSAGVAKREPARAVLDARVWPDGRRGGLGRRVARPAGHGVAAAGVAAGAGPG